MGTKLAHDLKVAVLVEIERHRAEMTNIKAEALAAGYTEEQFLAALLEVITDLGGIAVAVSGTDLMEGLDEKEPPRLDS